MRQRCDCPEPFLWPVISMRLLDLARKNGQSEEPRILLQFQRTKHRGDGKKFLKLTSIDMVVDLHPTVAAATVGF